MKENIGIKVVAGVFTLVGILFALLALIVIALIVTISVGLIPPPAVPFTDASNAGDMNPSGAILLSVICIFFSKSAFSTSGGLRRLEHWAYKTAFALIELSSFAIFSLFLFAGGVRSFSQDPAALVNLIVIPLVVCTGIATILFTNRQRFTGRRKGCLKS